MGTNKPAADDIKAWAEKGFLKSITWKYLKKLDDGRVRVKEIDYHIDPNASREMSLVCGNCGVPECSYLFPSRVGIIRCCTLCGTSTGPISQAIGTLGKEYYITNEEALEILKGRGMPKRTLLQYAKKIMPATLKKRLKARERPKTVQ